MATFYIEAIENTNIALVMVGSPTIGTVKYGINDSTCPNTYTVTTASTPISLTAGQKCYWFITSTSTNFSTSNYLNFTSTAKINVGGNLSDLIGGDTKIPRTYCFDGLFYNCAKLVSASNLVLVNDFNSKLGCYYNMFRGCNSLTTAPELPATTLTSYCYYSMFRDCTSLTTAPALPATTLISLCYSFMFYGCTSLTTPPELPATTLKDYCYRSMLQNCTNIKLSETQIAQYSIPYRIPSEGTGTEGTDSLTDMFSNTGGTFKGTPAINTTYYLVPYATFYIEAIENTDITLSKVGTPTVGDACYGVENHNVPNAYTYGDTIHLTAGQKCYWFITSTSVDFDSSNYLKFTSTAKINVGGNMSDLIGGATKIPRNYCFSELFNNCAKLVDASNLTIVNDFNSKTHCYRYMFRGCTSLTTAPELPATTLSYACYSSMFTSCGSLTTAPALPATTLANNCYAAMFTSCASLTTAPELPATTLAAQCYYNMFLNCTFLKTPPALPATTLTDYCYDFMFQGCTNIKLSETQVAPYSIPYRIPSEGTGTVGASSLDNMFTRTGGTFKGTPTINTTYYLAPYATFYIEAVENTNITLSKVGSPTVGDAYYGVNNHNVPNAYTYGNTISLTAGQRCYWTITSTTTAFTTSNYLNFTSTAKINVGGNMSDLIGGNTKIPRNYCFYRLFYDCTNLVSASDLVLVSDFDSKTYCYGAMFYSCKSLTAAPTLPATMLANYCYSNMFGDCASLKTAPELPATMLATGCYSNMFGDCASLKTAPELPATTLGLSCYRFMFYGCTSLTTAPELPATTLASACYQDMFRDCTSLTTAPTLPATTLASNCYQNMFYGCTSLTTAPALPATTLGLSCYAYMFNGCTSLTTAPELPVTTLTSTCYASMFRGCTSLTTAPELPATTLASACYQDMFRDCTSLTTAPELPATTLASACYNCMFQNCTSLTTAPELPATTIMSACYDSMFNGCTSLTTAPELPATTLATGCYRYMFQGCTNIKLSETQTAPYSIPYRIPSEGTGTEGTNSLSDMFTSTGGTFKGTPTINTIYYLAPPYSPIFITYKGQELANFESGSKTLKCGNKYMEDDIIITREIGTNDVVVLYNSGTILTFQNGTKTLKCAGNCMATDLDIQIS